MEPKLVRSAAVAARTRTRRAPGRRSLAAALVALVVVVGTACVPPDDLAVTVVADSLVQPWDVAFLPDGTMLATEKDGKIDAWVGGTKRVLADPTDSIIAGEGGMMGLAVDGSFATNRLIYTCFLRQAPGTGTRDVRVARWRVSDDLTTLTDRVDIITGIPYSTGRHSGCRPRFGPDGYLWVGTGDAAVGTHPQNPQSLGGKVLRVDRDGNGAPGNPGGAFLPQIYTYGHRNVQGIAFRPSDGQAFSVEHGTNCNDEVNELHAGGNYGWDPVPGYDESRPMTDLVKFPDAIPAWWSSGCPTIAPSGAVFIGGRTEWRGWNGQLVMAVLKGTEIRVLGRYAEGYQQDYVDVEDQGRLRSAAMGPDGNLYLTTDANPGKILRVEPLDLPDP